MSAAEDLLEETQLWLTHPGTGAENVKQLISRIWQNPAVREAFGEWRMSEVALRTPYAEVCAEIGEQETEPLVLRKLAQNPATPQTTQRRLLESPAWEYLLDNPNVSGETLTEIWEKLRHSSPAGVDTEDDILAHPNCPDRLAEEIRDSAVEEARIDH